jgi:NAD(P)-dependent dehydrogenase (short-subunit alcohol dehydrogenase family)
MSTILITGANRGIGFEMARQLNARGEDVIAVCRQAGQPLSDLGVRVIDGIDVAEASCVSRLAGLLEGQPLDWLVNNAGILDRDTLHTLDFDSVERQFRVNAMGPLRVSHALRENLNRGSKIFVVTSRMGSIDDNTSGAYYGYRMSKAAVNMAGKSLSEDLRDEGISVFLLHPGYVSTDMTNHQGMPVDRSVAGLIARMDELDLGSSGTFWHAEGYPLPW